MDEHVMACHGISTSRLRGVSKMSMSTESSVGAKVNWRPSLGFLRFHPSVSTPNSVLYSALASDLSSEPSRCSTALPSEKTAQRRTSNVTKNARTSHRHTPWFFRRSIPSYVKMFSEKKNEVRVRVSR